MSINNQPQYKLGIDARFLAKENGGLSRYTREFLKHLALIDQNNEYTIFLTEKDLKEWEIKQKNFHPEVVLAEHYSLAEQTKFVKELYKHKFDLVHFLNFNHPILYLRPFIVTLHDLTMYLFPTGRSQKSVIRRAGFNLVLKQALRRAKRVIAISEYAARDVEKNLKIPSAKIEVIYEGGPKQIDFPFGNRATTQSYLQTYEPYFLFVSQWRPHKGLLTLIEAFNILKEKHNLPHKLVLVGNQKASEVSVRQAIASSPFARDILTPGFVPEELLPLLYHNATAFILPSEYEGFGLTVLEAFSFQTPVIVANNSSLPEVAGNAALFFPTKDVAGLVKCMEEILFTPGLREDLIQKGTIQLKRFSWDLMAERTLNVYRQILEKRH